MPERAVAVDWAAVRAEFPSLKNWAFLNTATFGQMPQRSIDAVAAHFTRRTATACSDFLTWFGDADALRASLASLIHCTVDDIAFIPTASTALATLITGIDWRPGDRIVTFENEFPNNIYAPALLERRGVEFVVTNWERFADALTPSTRLVVVSEVNYSNGFRVPLPELSRMAHQAGALVYVDGTQSLGALHVDVRAFQPDLYCAHGYKWLLSPPGAAFMYVRPEVRKWLDPLVVGWRTHRTWRDVNNLHDGMPEFAAEAERYEGGVLSFPSLYGMKASVDMMLELGQEAIEQRVMELASLLRETLRGLGARLLFDEAPHFDSPVIAARFLGINPGAVCAELQKRGVLISARHQNLRISTHFYNSEADLERLADALKRVLT
ncbi:MAG TPA: aminotransferase class V-fold PLP-dependent enzyme [Bryobacteraceae bacterium]|nr:aminotransferase class V-fold PLP-dependent enzyme [Bryobacteraceae bacterium]